MELRPASEGGRMLSVYIVQLNVVGLQAGIKWYTDVLGFKVSAENNFLHHGTTVQLEHDQGFRLILHNARRPAKIDYPDDVQTMVVWQTQDLAGAMRHMKAKGVAFIFSEPEEINVGRYVAFRDPFGNVHELIELKR
jgi:catechol 2,3-dioxygenase-like lactoylglutathione lyase family enzyme